MSDLRTVPLVDAERLGFQVAAAAERHVTGWVREQLRVELLTPAGEYVGFVPAVDSAAAAAIAAELRTAGWHTRTGRAW